MGWTADSFKGKVDGEVQDMTRAIHGDHWLEGEIPGGGEKPDYAVPGTDQPQGRRPWR